MAISWSAAWPRNASWTRVDLGPRTSRTSGTRVWSTSTGWCAPPTTTARTVTPSAVPETINSDTTPADRTDRKSAWKDGRKTRPSRRAITAPKVRNLLKYPDGKTSGQILKKQRRRIFLELTPACLRGGDMFKFFQLRRFGIILQTFWAFYPQDICRHVLSWADRQTDRPVEL